MENPGKQPFISDQRKDTGSVGPLAASIIVIFILLFSCVYLWNIKIGPRIENKPSADSALSSPQEETLAALEQSSSAPDTKINELSTQGTSDEASDIEQDLNSVNVADLDADLQKL